MEANVCPGCHFGCAIDAPQCARGEKLRARWEDAGELPERRGPGQGPMRAKGQGGASAALVTDDRLMHLLHIVGIALHDLADESGSSAPERRVVDCLLRHEHAASVQIIAGRTHLPKLDETLGAICERGLAAQRQSGSTEFYELTDGGLQQARAWEAERRAAEAEFLGVLSEEEKDQLLALVIKVLEPGFRCRGM